LQLWERVLPAIRSVDREFWAELSNALHWWIYPNLPRSDLREEEREQFHAIPRRVLYDLVPFAEGHPGLSSALRELAEDVKMDLDLAMEPAFETLFPRLPRASPGEALNAALQAQREAARRLARKWERRAPQDVAKDLDRYSAEARWSRRAVAPTVSEFGEALAQQTAAPEEWLETFLDQKSGLDLVSPFLFRVVQERLPGWQGFLKRCLESPEHAWKASKRVLRLPLPPDDLLEKALEVAEPQLVEGACLRGVATETLRRLLTYADRRVVVAAAIGEWLAEPRQEVRPEVREEWRAAVLSIRARDLEDRASNELWLEEILSKDPELAFDWLRALLASSPSDRPMASSEQGSIGVAIRVLSRPQRSRILAELKPGPFSSSLLPHLVGNSSALYRVLVARSELRREHLAPLAGKPPDVRWSRLARIALDAGHDPRHVAAASLDFTDVYSPGAEHYLRWQKAFEWLSRSTNPGLREVGRHGLHLAEELVEKAREKEPAFQLAGHL
jgi:hypothetical protein